jgi:erythromycin esterase-like protein
MPPNHDTETGQATLDDWIAGDAVTFCADSPELFDAAVDRVILSLGESVEILGFGEALHFGEDLLLLRNRLFQELVENHGYTAIAIESSFPRARAVNEYVAGRGPASYEAVQDAGFGHGFGRLEANRELVEWMRRRNAEHSHGVKLRFYGFDMPGVTGGPASPREVLHFALDYLASMDGAGGQPHRDRIDALLGEDPPWENPMAWRDPASSAELVSAASALRIETEELISALRVRRPELAAKSGESRYLEAMHHASLARNLLTFFAALARDADYAPSLAVRDALMADNLAYIAAREHGRGRVFAFAHNAHLQRGRAELRFGADVCAWWPMGAHLNEMFGRRYAVIGSAVGVSEANGITSPEAGTLEARLTAAPGPARFIQTHRGEGLSAAAIAALPMRTGSTKNPSYCPLTGQSITDFDWLAVLDSTAYSRGGPPLP